LALNFKEITFDALRGKAGLKDRAWSKMVLTFTDTETDHAPSIALVLLQTARPETTIGELEREATGLAKTILREALNLIEAQDVTSLVQGQAARDEEDRGELAALQEPFKLDG